MGWSILTVEKKRKLPGVLAHAFNTQEAEARESRNLRLACLQYESQANQDCIVRYPVIKENQGVGMGV